MRFGLPSILTLALILPLGATAQLIGPVGSATPFTLSVDPQYPAPYSQATISARSDSLDLTNATMTVTSGGKTVYQGNVQPASLTLGKGGSATQVEVTVA